MKHKHLPYQEIILKYCYILSRKKRKLQKLQNGVQYTFLQTDQFKTFKRTFLFLKIYELLNYYKQTKQGHSRYYSL